MEMIKELAWCKKRRSTQGRMQTIWKLWFQKLKLTNLHKIGKYNEGIEKISHIQSLSIDTKYAPVLHTVWKYGLLLLTV